MSSSKCAGRWSKKSTLAYLGTALVVLTGLLVVANPLAERADAATIPIVFPLEKRALPSHQFMTGRSGHPHQGIDLFAPKMTKERAAVSGTVTLQVRTYNGQPWYTLWLAGDDGHGYYYSHINNDTPGTDNGKGGLRYAFAPGLVTGTHVRQGQVIAYCGDSGNAENTSPHLHFQIHESTDITSIAIDPYDSLRAAPLFNGTPAPAWPAYSARRVEQTDPSITYTGAWGSVSGSDASGGSYASAKANAAALIWFEGTKLDLFAMRGPTQGIALVSLDGLPAERVDLYHSTTLVKRAVWSSGALSKGTHTVQVSWAGERSVPTGGARINIDSVYVTGKLIKAPLISISQQNNSLFSYKGTWRVVSTGSASAGSLRTLDSTGSFAAQFSGTYFGLIAKQGPAYGKAKVTVDGRNPQTIDFYSPISASQQKIWNTGIVRYGVHIVKVEWTGTKNPASTGTLIDVDALQVIGGFNAVGSRPWEGPMAGKTIQPPTPPVPGLVRYEQGDTLLRYSGAWMKNDNAPLASGGRFRFLNSAGSVTVTFKGTYLAWIAKKGPQYGKAEVTLDANAPVTVDLYGTSETWKTKAWNTGTLENGTHTVKIVWTGQKTPAATATNISVDAFDIIGTLK